MHGERDPGEDTLGIPSTHLHPLWRYGLSLAWAATLVGLLVPENQGYDLGKRPFWWDGVLLVVAAVVAMVVLVLKDWRWAPLASIGLSLALIALGPTGSGRERRHRRQAADHRRRHPPGVDRLAQRLVAAIEHLS